MSPEQARGLEVDERTDIFSLGVVAYELLTGQPAFSGTTTGDVLASLFEQEPPPLSRQAPHLPVALQHSINRAIAKDRSARYAKCADLLSDVKALKQELEVAAHLKRPGDAPINTASLGLRVGHAANGHTNHAERAAVQTAQAAAPTTRKSLWLPSGKPLVQAAACVVLLVGALLIWRQWNPSRARSFNAIASIAVLPFVNASGDSQMEYLSDGLTEALMQSLSQLSGLRVMSRGAVFAYKGREIDPRQVGQDLAVAALVSGRIQQQGERLIIQTEMVNTADGARLWGGRYDRLQSDAQTVQAEIAREISTRLQAHLRTEERRELAARPAANSEAYRLYLLGRHLHYQITRENFPHVLGLYQRAIAADARLALAHSGVAHVYADASSQYLPPAQAIPQAKQAALTALSLDDNLPEAHLAVALVQFWGDWDWPGAEKTFNRTLALNPNYSAAHAYYASLLAVQKRFDEALRAIQRAEELDPSSAGYSASVASIYYVARQYDRAEAKARHMLTVHPQGVGASNAHSTLG
jgi:TolB-like protein